MVYWLSAKTPSSTSRGSMTSLRASGELSMNEVLIVEQRQGRASAISDVDQLSLAYGCPMATDLSSVSKNKMQTPVVNMPSSAVRSSVTRTWASQRKMSGVQFRRVNAIIFSII